MTFIARAHREQLQPCIGVQATVDRRLRSLRGLHRRHDPTMPNRRVPRRSVLGRPFDRRTQCETRLSSSELIRRTGFRETTRLSTSPSGEPYPPSVVPPPYISCGEIWHARQNNPRCKNIRCAREESLALVSTASELITSSRLIASAAASCLRRRRRPHLKIDNAHAWCCTGQSQIASAPSVSGELLPMVSVLSAKTNGARLGKQNEDVE